MFLVSFASCSSLMVEDDKLGGSECIASEDIVVVGVAAEEEAAEGDDEGGNAVVIVGCCSFLFLFLFLVQPNDQEAETHPTIQRQISFFSLSSTPTRLWQPRLEIVRS
jgi:hypothetical protein